MPTMRFVECTTEKEFAANYPLVAEIYPDISKENYVDVVVPEMVRCGHKQVVAYEENEARGLAGFTEGVRLYKGKVIQIHNAIVPKKYRSKGVGKALFDWIEDLAKKKGCMMVIFDSYYDNEQAHKFFYREGYTIKAYTFMKDL